MNVQATHPLVRQCAILRVLGRRAILTVGELHDALERLTDDEVVEAVQAYAVHVGGGWRLP